MKIQVLYVDSELVYQDKTVASVGEARPLLDEFLKPGMAAKLLVGQDKEAANPKMPCAVINRDYTDGKATLNIYPEDPGFIAVWTVDAPSWKFLRFIKKNYTTKPMDVSSEMIAAELDLLNASNAAEFMNRCKISHPEAR